MEAVRPAAAGHWPLELEAPVHVEFASLLFFLLCLFSLCLLFGPVLLLLPPTSLVVTSDDEWIELAGIGGLSHLGVENMKVDVPTGEVFLLGFTDDGWDRTSKHPRAMKL